MCRGSSAFFFSAVGGILLAGCGEPATGPTVLQPRSQFFWDDVPVPKGFKLDRRKSTHNLGAGHRTSKHVFMGEDGPQAVSNFYRRKMPEYKWELVEEESIVLQNGVDYLNYRKGNENCSIRIEETPTGWFGSKTSVCIDIQPE